MAIKFQASLFLLLFLPAILLLVWWWRTQLRVSGARRYLIVALRTLIFALLILALAGLQLLFPVREETVVFVLDRSASMPEDAQINQFIRKAIEGKKAEDQYALVSVGAEAIVEQPLTQRAELGSVGVILNQHATNLAEGIRVGAAMIPSGARGKLILLSDGLETQGDALTELKLVQERGIAVEAVSIQRQLEEEVLLSTVQLPAQLFADEEFQLSVEVESTIATEGILRIYEGNLEVGREAIHIERGRNTYLFSKQIQQEGFHRYRIELEAERDTIQVNNQGYAYTEVLGAPKVLIIEGEEGVAHNLAQALSAGNMEIEVQDPQLLPRELEGYKEYASIILANVQATQIHAADMERIQTAVRDLGLGLIMTGGSNSFGLGGWFKTPIEEALPVAMDLKSKEELPSLGLVLVIDKSGSMSSGMGGPNKMELAKEAAIRATDLLQEQDHVSVVAFDGLPWVVVEMQSASNLEEIQEKIGGIFASGGTEIYSALVEGYAQAQLAEVQRKHVILLTDGQSGSANYASLLEEMLEEGITVSTVAIGDDADTFLLEDLAEWGKGRYYFANDPSSVPQIVSKETALASRTFIVEEPHIPHRVGGREWTALRQALPFIHAYLATTPKQTAELVLQSVQGDPLLARWQYGLGRSVAWTSDLRGEWSPAWVSWEENSHFWNQVVSWTFPQNPQGNWQVKAEVDGVTGLITVDLPLGVALPQQMEAIVIKQNLEREAVQLKPVQPSQLQGEFSALEPGSYLIQVFEKEGQSIVASETTGVNIAYSPEYRLHQGGHERLQTWMEVSGGQLIFTPEDVFRGELPRQWRQRGISTLLFILAVLLWPVDIAVRRIQLSASLFERIKQMFKRRKEGQTSPSAHATLLGELNMSKTSRHDSAVKWNKQLYSQDKVNEEKYTAIRASRHRAKLDVQRSKVDAQEGKAFTKESQPGEQLQPGEDPFARLLAAKRKNKK